MPEKNNSAVGVLVNHLNVECAFKEQQISGFEIKIHSFIGKGYHTEQNVIGHYSTANLPSAYMCDVETGAYQRIKDGKPTYTLKRPGEAAFKNNIFVLTIR